MNRTHRTEKGTVLPLRSLRGQEYLDVKYRVVWFREEKPNWRIETDVLSFTPEMAYARAQIKDETGAIIATSHKMETKAGFPDYLEKAETGAIGRALALVGYGTQFCAGELDEGQRIVDSPVDSKPKTDSKPTSAPAKKWSPSLGNLESIKYAGKFPEELAGRPIGEFDTAELERGRSQLANWKSKTTGAKITKTALDCLTAIEELIAIRSKAQLSPEEESLVESMIDADRMGASITDGFERGSNGGKYRYNEDDKSGFGREGW